MKKCLILVDYANCDWKKIDFKQLVFDICLNCKKNGHVIDLLIFRFFGGWYLENEVAEQKFDAQRKIASWPTMLRVELNVVRISYTFADGIIGYEQNDNAIIRQTYVQRRAKLKGIKIKKKENCTNMACSIKTVQRWLGSSHSCTLKGCETKFDDMFVRYEQKQVDSHLLCDFILSLKDDKYSKIFIMSSDIDFMPGIQTAVLLGMSSKIGIIKTKNLSNYQFDFIKNNNLTLLSSEGE